MIIVMKAGAVKHDRDEVLKRIKELGYKPHVIHGTTRDVIGAIGDERGKLILQSIEGMHGVESVVPILKPYKLASREVNRETTLIRLSDSVVIGGEVRQVPGFKCMKIFLGQGAACRDQDVIEGTSDPSPHT